MKKTFFLLALFILMLFISIIYFYQIGFMEIGEQEAAKLRDELHNLNINRFDDRQDYYQKLYYIIASGEGFSGKIYKDSNGILTIGYGFNMDRGPASQKEWDSIFEGSISFQQAKNGEITITKEQAQMLKKYGVERREEELERAYSPYWHNMRLNERAIITDLYYQLPDLAKNGTNFARQMKTYYRTGDVKYLDMAVEEVRLRSSNAKNPLSIPGLRNRNKIRAIILDSRDCPLYSNPHDKLIPEDKQIEVVIGETFISKETSAKFPESNQLNDYYIWRTCKDDKVRSSHRDLEGRVFMHEYKMLHPKDDYGCRCYRQRLPINAKIVKKKMEKMIQPFTIHNKEIYVLQPALKKVYSDG